MLPKKQTDTVTKLWSIQGGFDADLVRNWAINLLGGL